MSWYFFLAPLGGQNIIWISQGVYILEMYDGLSELVAFAQIEVFYRPE